MLPDELDPDPDPERISPGFGSLVAGVLDDSGCLVRYVEGQPVVLPVVVVLPLLPDDSGCLLRYVEGQPVVPLGVLLLPLFVLPPEGLLDELLVLLEELEL